MKNFWLALSEAGFVLLITQIPIWIGLVVIVLGDENATITSILGLLGQKFSPGDVLSYAAGILGSSTAYAIMKIGHFSVKPVYMLPLIAAPFFAILLAVPVYIQDVDGQIKNELFARWYVGGVLLFSAVLWINALYQSRAFFDVSPINDKQSKRIVDEIEDPKHD